MCLEGRAAGPCSRCRPGALVCRWGFPLQGLSLLPPPPPFPRGPVAGDTPHLSSLVSSLELLWRPRGTSGPARTLQVHQQVLRPGGQNRSEPQALMARGAMTCGPPHTRARRRVCPGIGCALTRPCLLHLGSLAAAGILGIGAGLPGDLPGLGGGMGEGHTAATCSCPDPHPYLSPQWLCAVHGQPVLSERRVLPGVGTTEPARGLSGGFQDWASRSEHFQVSVLSACRNRPPTCLCGQRWGCCWSERTSLPRGPGPG